LRNELPGIVSCHDCAVVLAEPYGWCSNCSVAYCYPCARQHFCLPSCAEAGCIAGRCVRVHSAGELAAEWGVPDDPDPRMVGQLSVPRAIGLIDDQREET
jgi:hypothetical protein